VSWIASVLSNFWPFILIISILVFVHELGHFLVARYNGVKVTVFSIGFGPEILGWTDRKGTRWRFSLLPLGGYVQMFGDADPSSSTQADTSELTEEEKTQTLSGKPPLQRIAVAAAGPLANIIFAILVCWSLVAIKGIPVIPATVQKVVAGGLAERSDIRAGDKILKVGDFDVTNQGELSLAISKAAKQDSKVLIEREGKTIEKIIGFYTKDDKTGELTAVSKLSVEIGGVPQYSSASFSEGFVFSCKYCWFIFSETLKSLINLMAGKGNAKELGGILSIGSMASDGVKKGLDAVLMLMVILSINLGLINLFPIPVLDGGHILFASIELLRGRPLSQKFQQFVLTAGFVFVMGVMLYGFWNDLVRFNIIQNIIKWF